MRDFGVNSEIWVEIQRKNNYNNKKEIAPGGFVNVKKETVMIRMKVVLSNLTKKFPNRDKKAGADVVAVNGFSFEIPDGKLVGLLGPSGCGKSTTLHLLSGLQKPTAGKIYFGDDDVTNLPPEHRGVGLVLQNYALYPHLTVMQNIVFRLRIKKGRIASQKSRCVKKPTRSQSLCRSRSLWSVSRVNFPAVSSSAWQSHVRL